MHRIAFAVALVPLAIVLSAAPAAAVEPEQVVATATRISSVSADTSRAFPADGQVLVREGMAATFTEGTFHPIVREDDRVVGLMFDGLGHVRFTVPAGLETAAWAAGTDHAADEIAIGAAYLRFTDATLDELQGERAWGEHKDAGGELFRLFENRTGLLDHPLWTRWAAHLDIDQLVDLYGGGHVGGHLYADFRHAGSVDWTTYLHNPRGALLRGETTTIFRVRRLGDVPPELDVLASFGDSPEAAPAYDIQQIALDVKFPTPGRKQNRNLVGTKIVADLDLVATRPDQPLKAVVLELESERLLCAAQSDLRGIRVRRAVDGEGRTLAAVHRKNRLFVPLAAPVEPGGSVHLTLEYEGPMTQGIPVQGMPDVYFTPLGPWAFYPRSPDLDRFGSRIEVHMPRFMSAVAPGRLVEQRKEKEGWHFVYEEPSGVKTLQVIVGDFIRSNDSQTGSSPEIIAWMPRGSEKEIGSAVPSVRGMVDFAASVWGAYPYTALHVVEDLAYPAGNWLTEGGGDWSCVPPSNVHPWQGFVDGASGIVTASSPTTAPSKTVQEERVYTRLLFSPMEAAKYNRFVDVVRQWWGHMVPAASPDDAWIPEALVHWTGLIFVRAATGEPAMVERLEYAQREMIEWADEAPPLALGERLGAEFAPQVWGRGPLVVNWLIGRMEPTVFKNAMNTLINRGAAHGVSRDLFVETVGGLGDSGIADGLAAIVDDNYLPAVTFLTVIDKDRGEVVVVLQQPEESFVPVDVPVRLVRGPKDKETKTARMLQPTQVLRWKVEDVPKRVQVDPMHLALVRSLKKDKDLEPLTAPPPAEEAAE